MKQISRVFKGCLVLCAVVKPKRGSLFSKLFVILVLSFGGGALFLFPQHLKKKKKVWFLYCYALLSTYHHPMHFYKCQELCVYRFSLTPNIYSVQQHSPQSLLIASMQNCGCWYVKSHRLQFAISPGTCNIAFRFPSSAGTARAQINCDISLWCVWFVWIT